MGRIHQSLGALCGFVEKPWMLPTGFGAGNIDAATKAGADLARHVLKFMDVGKEAILASGWYRTMTPDTIWTMSAYTSVVTEYGLAGFALLLIVVLRFVAQHDEWDKRALCWLVLVIYLCIQFEGYAFAALPLFIWELTHGNSHKLHMELHR